MTMRAAIIANGVVTNIAQADPSFAASQGWIITDTAQIGWGWNGTTFTPPAAPSPESVLAEKRARSVLSRAQFVQAVFLAGLMTKQEAVAAASGSVPNFFSAALDALVADGTMIRSQADEAEILWAGLTQVERNHPLMPIAQGALSLTDAQVDALFGIV